MIGFIISALKIIFLLGFLIFIHEGGHFLVAKLCKVKVNEFAIGFGPTIWRKQGKETKYALRLIPLGGFVSMEGEEQRSEHDRSFSKASIPRRIAIVLAGGLVNIVFGLLVYFILVAMLNYPTTNTDAKGNYILNEIEQIASEQTDPDLQQGDKILKIEDHHITLYQDIEKALSQVDGKEITVTIERNGTKQEIKVTPVAIPVRKTGISLKEQRDNYPKIIQVEKESPAAKQGLQVGDEIVAVNGVDTANSAQKVIELISQSDASLIQIKVQREKQMLEIALKPTEECRYKLGVVMKVKENANFFEKIYYGTIDTAEFSVSIIDNLKMLFTGGVTADQLMGPVGISDFVANTNSVKEFIAVLALISLSLGVTNLLPFPPLDGGKVVLLIIEAIRRKPMKENTEIMLQTLGFGVLILLSIYVTYHDVLRIF